MESVLAQGTDQRIPELDVSVYQNQASYVIKREQTSTTCPTPAISPSSVRTAKFNIVDGNFLDLSTLHFTFTVVNLDNTDGNSTLTPASAIPHCWWRGAIVKVNGATVEDVNHLSRLEEQITRFCAPNKRRNWGDAGTGWATLTDLSTDAVSKSIPRFSSKRVTWRPVSLGFLQCGKYLPMMGGAAGGLQIELECADLLDACLNVAGRSATWELRDLQCHVSSVQLASEMTSSFADMLIAGESILIPYQANSMDVQYLTGAQNVNLSLAKQFSRLATVFVSLEDGAGATAPTALEGPQALTKSMNNFSLPAASADGPNAVESYIQVNNQRWPQFNTVGTKHHFMRLLQCLGVWNSISHSVCISAAGYGDGEAPSRQFVAGFDLESVPGAEASGIPVQGGGTVQISLKNISNDATRAQKAYIPTHYDAVLELKSQGAIVYS